MDKKLSEEFYSKLQSLKKQLEDEKAKPKIHKAQYYLSLEAELQKLREYKRYSEEYKDWVKLKQENQKLREIAIYVRDNHLCGTPLQKAIAEVIPEDDKETSITN